MSANIAVASVSIPRPSHSHCYALHYTKEHAEEPKHIYLRSHLDRLVSHEQRLQGSGHSYKVIILDSLGHQNWRCRYWRCYRHLCRSVPEDLVPAGEG